MMDDDDEKMMWWWWWWRWCDDAMMMIKNDEDDEDDKFTTWTSREARLICKMKKNPLSSWPDIDSHDIPFFPLFQQTPSSHWPLPGNLPEPSPVPFENLPCFAPIVSTRSEELHMYLKTKQTNNKQTNKQTNKQNVYLCHLSSKLGIITHVLQIAQIFIP